MSDQCQRPERGWTIETLGRFLEQRLDDNDRRVSQRFDDNAKLYERWFHDAEANALATAISLKDSMIASLAAAKEAVDKAEVANNKRFDAVNEFRAALSDLTGQKISRTEVDGKFSAVEERIARNATRLDRIEAKGAGMSALWVLIVGGIVAIAAIADVLVRVAGK